MEYDRFAHHHVLYIGGLIALVFGIVGIVGTVYFLPYIFFDWPYAIPPEFYSLAQKLQTNYLLTKSTAELSLVGGLFFLGLLFLLIAELISNYLDQHEFRLHKVEISKKIREEEHDEFKKKSDTWKIFLVVLMILLIAVLSIRLLEWSISSTPMSMQ
jgi:NhaP-type Na+/H+ or K+/H+ antiporter